MKLMLLPLMLLASAIPASNQIAIIGNYRTARLIYRLVKAAERNDTKAFNEIVGKTYRTQDRKLPTIEDVDRRDEGCSLKTIDARSKTLPEAIWDCPGHNDKPHVERMFLVDHGLVTSMWNEWGSGIM